MKIRIILTAVLISVVLSINAGFAADPVYTLGGFVVSSGGALNLTNGGYVLHDLKGQPLAGSISSGGYTLGLGGVYTGFVPTIIVAQGVPEGTVPIKIDREGTNIVVSWPGDYANPQIYSLIGDGTGKYTNAIDPWKLVVVDNNTIIAGLNKITFKNAIGGGDKEIYFKGLQSGMPKEVLVNAIAFGKIEYVFGQGNTFFNYPFKEQTENEIFKNVQVPVGARIMGNVYATASFNFSEFNGRLWPAADVIVPGNGNLFYNPSNQINVALLGEVRSAANVTRNIKNGNNLVGVPYPKKMAVASFANSPVLGDRILIQNRANANFDIINYSGQGAWEANAAYPNFGLEATKGYWYQRSTGNGVPAFNWIYQRP